MREPMRVIEGEGRPFEAFWRFVDAGQSQSGETEIEFFGPISEYSWWGDEITPKLFKDELNSKGKGGPVTLKVHSPGGELFAAVAIRSILQDYTGRVTAEIIGLAASAATVVVTGADVVKMRDTAMFMIHDPGTVAWGTLEEMRQVVEVLEQAKETIVTSYQKKTKLGREELAEMMKAETWMTAEEAKGFGFVDEITTGEKSKTGVAKNMRAAFLNCLGGYKIPENLKPQITQMAADEEEEDEVIPAGGETSAPEADNAGALSDEARDFRNYVQELLKGRQ